MPSAIETSGRCSACSSKGRSVSCATRRAVPAMSCMRPIAFATLLASGLKADSSRMMAHVSAGGNPRRVALARDQGVPRARERDLPRQLPAPRRPVGAKVGEAAARERVADVRRARAVVEPRDRPEDRRVRALGREPARARLAARGVDLADLEQAHEALERGRRELGVILGGERARRLARHGRLEGRSRERVVERAQPRVREQHVVVERRLGHERGVAPLGVLDVAGQLADPRAEVLARGPRAGRAGRPVGREARARAIERRPRARRGRASRASRARRGRAPRRPCPLRDTRRGSTRASRARARRPPGPGRRGPHRKRASSASRCLGKSFSTFSKRSSASASRRAFALARAP